ncbi:hypothetical protein MFIFM68171_03086 [Madurella fahalii]|uniref:Uncharacterized protein n=1 Tax=Madurella fahalii TaxID=1157608 RepID=A0ABQ0G540_9PEZI
MGDRTEQQQHHNNLRTLAQIPSDLGYSLRRFADPRTFNPSPGGGDRLHARCELPLTWALRVPRWRWCLRLLQGPLREQPWRRTHGTDAVAPATAGSAPVHHAADATAVAVMSRAERAARRQQLVARSRARARARMRGILRGLEEDLRGLGV